LRLPAERLGLLVRAVVFALPEDELTRTVLAQVTALKERTFGAKRRLMRTSRRIQG
jgi:hypothetical protein